MQWDEAAASERAASLRASGHEVALECHDGAEAYRKARQDPPDVVVLDLDHKASHSWQTARPLAKAKLATRLIFLGGDQAARARAAKEAPKATFVAAEDLEEALSPN